MPTLTLVIPLGPGDDALCERLLASLQTQTFPQADLETLIIRQGNSEEAKALGILRAQGEFVCLCCTDNEFPADDPTLLQRLVEAAATPGVVGAYTRHYAYRRTDPALTRYFALLGANDPLCWWLAKADRASYLRHGVDCPSVECDVAAYRLDRLPSLGDNGCVYKADLLRLVVNDPAKFGSCMDICADLAWLGYATWAIVPGAIVHNSGHSLWRYLQKRWRYTRTLYWQQQRIRRWHLVGGARDYLGVVSWLLASLVVFPHLYTALRGYGQVRDRAWGYHLVVSLLLAGVYLGIWGLHLRSSFRRWIGPRRSPPVSPPSVGRP